MSGRVSPIARAPRSDLHRRAYALATEAVLAAVRAFDEAALDAALRRAFALAGAADVVERVITPSLRALGSAWAAGERGLAEEHFATQAIGTALRERVRRVPCDARVPALLACFADEDHDLGLLALALRLLEHGMRPLVLGARTPPEALRDAIDVLEPRLVALSVTIPPGQARAEALVRGYADACEGRPWIVGGAGAGAVKRWVEPRGGLVVEPHDGLGAAPIRALVQTALAE